MLARRDDALSLAIGRDGWLEFRRAGEFLGWITLYGNGAPTAQGVTEDGESRTGYGELLAFGPVNRVRSRVETSGWSFELLSFRAGDGPFPVSTTAPGE